MQKNRFIKDAIKLTLISIIMRAVGTGFMIYISNAVGAEGIGLFQLVTSIYFLFVTLSTSGISIAVTRLVSEEFALDSPATAKVAFRRCLTLAVALSTVSSVLLFALANPLAVGVLNDGRALLSLKLFAVGLPFLSTASVIRGYFLGIKRGVSAASTDVVEMIVQMAVTLLALKLLPQTIEYACCALVIGSVASEVISCIYAFLLLRLRRTRQGSGQPHTKGLTRRIFSIILPVSVSNYIRSALSTIENVAMPQGLKRFGQDYSVGLAQYGMVKGMAMPLLLFPSCILSAFTSLLVPEVASANAVNNRSRIDFIIDKAFKVTLLYAFLITGLFFCFGKELSMMFYRDNAVGAMLLALTPLVPFLYLDQIVDSILKGLNQQLSAMKYNSVDSLIRVLIILFLVPICGLKGYIIMLYTGTIFNAILSINRLVVVGKVRFRMVRWVLLPIAAIVAACLFTRMLLHTPLALSILFTMGAYVLLLVLFGCVTARDCAWVKHMFRRA